MPEAPAALPARNAARPELLVACLCADWCRTCGLYRDTFEEARDALQAEYPAQPMRFVWVDIEDESDLIGDLDIENFPTLLIADAAGARFFGPVMPQASAAERLIRGALGGALAADIERALVEHVGALVPRRLIAPRPA
jgi:hypothetical protein